MTIESRHAKYTQECVVAETYRALEEPLIAGGQGLVLQGGPLEVRTGGGGEVGRRRRRGRDGGEEEGCLR